MYGYGHGMGGWGIGLMTVSFLLFWALVVVAIVLLVRHFGLRPRAGPAPAPGAPRDIHGRAGTRRALRPRRDRRPGVPAAAEHPAGVHRFASSGPLIPRAGP